MTKIGLIADTHGFLDDAIAAYFKDCDEIWHAGDFGDSILVNQLKQGKIFRGVYGNIDGPAIRSDFPVLDIFWCEAVKVMIKHIGGYPPRYNPETKKELLIHRPQLFITGHSHILRVMYDNKIECLYMNPGAAGKQGWHKMRTIIRFDIEGKDIKNCEVIELGKK